MAQDHISRIIADTRQFDAKITASMRVLQSLNQYIHEVGEGNAYLSKTEREVIKGMGDFEVSATTTEGAVKQLTSMLKELTNTYRKMGAEMQNGLDGQEALRSIEKLQSRLREAKADLASMSDAASTSGGKSAFGAIFGGNLAARAAMDALRGVKNVVRDAININKEFEYSNAELSAVLGQSKDDIGELTTQAKQLGATTLYTANEITNLQISLARLGFNKQEIKNSTEAISQLALATGVDLKDAATLTGSTLRAFGYDAAEAARVASVLGVSTTKSALDMNKLKTAMGYASSVARQAGFEIEDVVAMLGKMVDNGQQATTAGVNMRNIMLDLSDKSSKLSKAIKKVTGKEQITSFEEFIYALRQMRDAGMNMDDVAKIIQRRVTPGFLNLIANTEGVSKLRDELKNCDGELQNMADKMTNTLQGSITLFKSAWDGLMLTFSNSNGTLKETFDGLTKILNKMREARSLSNGGDDAIGLFERGTNKKDYENQKKWYDLQIQNKTKGKNGKELDDAMLEANSEVYSLIENNIKDKSAILNELVGLYSEYNADKKKYGFLNQEDFILKWGKKVGDRFNKTYTRGDEKIYGSSAFMNPLGGEARDFLLNKDENGFEQTIIKMIAGYKDQIATQKLLQSKYSKAIDAVVTGDVENLRGGKGILDKDNEKTTKSPAESAAEKVAKAEQDYAQAVAKAAMDFESGKTDYVGYMEQLYNGSERLYQAYMDAANIVGDDRYKNAMESLRASTIALGQTITETKNNIKAEGQAAKALSDEQKAIRKIDNHTYQQLYNVARDARSQRANFEESAKLIELLKPFKEKMNGDLTLDIPDEVWLEFVKKIMNPMLEKMVLPQIELDAASGNVTKLKNGKIGNQSAYTGSVMDLAGNAVGAISSITTNLETLGVNISDQFKEGLNKLTAVVNIAQTIAAIVSTIQSIQVAMMIKGFIPFLHTGGMVHAAQGVFVPGNMREGVDTVPAMLSPGELVLNHAQQSNLAAQLQGLGSMRNARLVTKVSGGDILIALDNTNRSRGGSRGTYAYSK